MCELLRNAKAMNTAYCGHLQALAQFERGQMSNYDKIITSAPVNAQAAKQLSRGIHFTPQKNLGNNVIKEMPKVIEVTELDRRNPKFVDYTGHKFDRITVIGKSDKKIAKNYGAWVCSCVCGCYLRVKTKDLRNGRPNGKPHMCTSCDYTDYLRNGMRQ